MKRLTILLALIGALCSCGSGKNSQPSNIINGHEFVDLGLPSGLKWATCNLGASSPEEVGGEYSLSSKVVGSGNPSYDAANANWGGSWRMPTYEEMIELELYCKCETIDKEDGKYLKITGPNDNYIVVPAREAYIAQGGFVFLYAADDGPIECWKFYIPELEEDISGCIRPVSGEKMVQPEVRRKVRFDEYSHPLHVGVGGGWSINGNVEVDYNNPHLFIHIGPPITSYQAQYGNAPRIEINGKFVTYDKIDELVVTKLYEDGDSVKDSIHILIHAHQETPMGIIHDVEKSLKGRWTANVLYDINDDLYMRAPSQTDAIVSEENRAIVKINSQDRVLFGSMPIMVNEIKDEVKRFIRNPYNDPNLPGKNIVPIDYKGQYYEFPSSEGMILLETNRGTSYKTYLSVYHEIICAFDELRDEESLRAFGQGFSDLNKEQQEIIKSVVPTSCYKITAAYQKEIAPQPTAPESRFLFVTENKDDIEVEDVNIETEDNDANVECTEPVEDDVLEEDALEEEAIQRLKDIRTLQEAYKDVKGYYASSIDSLKLFYNTGSIKVIFQVGSRDDSLALANTAKLVKQFKEKGVKPRDMCRVFYEELKHNGNLRVVFSVEHDIPVRDSLFNTRKNFCVDSLSYIPFTGGGEQIVMRSVVRDVLGVKMPLFEAMIPYSSLLRGLDETFVNKIIADREDAGLYPGLKVGDIERPNNNAGNWE